MRKTLSLLLMGAVLLMGYEATACTNFLFTKGATKDGSTMITYAADSHVLYGELYYRKAADYPEDLFQPGKIPDLLNRLFSPGRRFLRAVDSSGRTAVWAAFQNMNEGTDVLWFIPNEDMPVASLSGALCRICAEYKGRRALKADVPAGISGKIFQQAGFTRQQTLAWMWKRL